MLRLALIQPPAALGAPSDRLAWLAAALPAVAVQGADLVLLPELFACGYNIGADLQDRAERQDGPTAHAMSELAKQYGLAICYGWAERDGTQLYNAATCVGADGNRLSHQHKLAIPPGFERDHFSPGQGCHLFTLHGLRIATLICYDVEFPETVRHVAGLGADLVLAPTALGAQWGWVARTMIPCRAYENGIWLAYANSAGTQRDMAFLGESVIAAPNGTEAAHAGADPSVIIADIDPDRVRAAQSRLPYLDDASEVKQRLRP